MPPDENSVTHDDKSDAIKPEYLNALRLTLKQQIPWLVLCALLLDSGRVFRLCLITVLGFWLFAMLCLARGHRKPDPVGLLFLRWGFFPLFAVVCVASGYIRQVFPQ